MCNNDLDSIFEQKPSYFCFCQIFSRDSFRDINIIDTSIHPSRDKQFMKGQKYIKRAMEKKESMSVLRINYSSEKSFSVSKHDQ